VELDIKGFHAFAMTQLPIPKGKPKWIDGIVDGIDTMTYIFII
jgi:hypothetical protein